jgi:hypothetical protein
MKIINVNKNYILADKIFLSDKFLARLMGLLSFKSFDKNQAMILRPSNSVHTFFMRFPIDVLFVDKNNSIVRIVRHMKPFRVTGVYLKSKFVVELPVGVIDATKTSVGDYLQIQ